MINPADIQPGMRVQTLKQVGSGQIVGTDIPQELVANRQEEVFGTVVAPRRSDLWDVRHDDGTLAVYADDDLKIPPRSLE